VRALIVGDGPEGPRLRALAEDLGVRELVEFRASVPYDEMPAVYAHASCLVLASLPVRFWEEQFGMVLAEAMAGHVPIVASTSGAIPEVVGPHADYVAPGDWVGLARALEEGPLAAAPGSRRAAPAERLVRFSLDAAAQRLGAVYDELLGRLSPPRDDGRRDRRHVALGRARAALPGMPRRTAANGADVRRRQRLGRRHRRAGYGARSRRSCCSSCLRIVASGRV